LGEHHQSMESAPKESQELSKTLRDWAEKNCGKRFQKLRETATVAS